MTAIVSEILAKVGAYVDQDTTAPTGTDETVRLNLINRAINEWGSTYEWKELRYPFAPTILASMTSVGLPANFRKLMTPAYDMSVAVPTQYVERDANARFENNSGQPDFIWVGGDTARGRYMNFSAPLTSGASIVFDYQAFPSSVVTTTDVVVVREPEYVATRVIAYILESRSDSRFPQVKADADRWLQSMIEDEMAPSGGQNNQVNNIYKQSGFVIGEW